MNRTRVERIDITLAREGSSENTKVWREKMKGNTKNKVQVMPSTEPSTSS